MTGVVLFGIAALWLAVCGGAAYAFTRPLKPPAAQWLCAILLLGALTPLPLIDEIAGRQKFSRLCAENGSVHIDAAKTVGRTVSFAGSERLQLEMSGIRVTRVKRTYADAGTHEPIYHYFRLEAGGGWLVRHLGLLEGGRPLLFDGVCQPRDLEDLDGRLGLVRVYQPAS